MLRIGNGMMMSGVMGMCLATAPSLWWISGMAVAFVVGYIFPAMQ